MYWIEHKIKEVNISNAYPSTNRVVRRNYFKIFKQTIVLSKSHSQLSEHFQPPPTLEPVKERHTHTHIHISIGCLLSHTFYSLAFQRPMMRWQHISSPTAFYPPYTHTKGAMLHFTLNYFSLVFLFDSLRFLYVGGTHSICKHHHKRE